MPDSYDWKYDFFLSHTHAEEVLASEVATVLLGERYKVFVRPPETLLTKFAQALLGGGAEMAIKNSRDLIVLYTKDYETFNFYDYTIFDFERSRGSSSRRIIVLRCENAPLIGWFVDHPYVDLSGNRDPGDRRRRILRAVAVSPIEPASPDKAVPPQSLYQQPLEGPTFVRPDRTNEKRLFVCHVSENRDVALSVVRDLERLGVACWLAPRDVKAGLPYDDQIAEAIERCTGMLIIFSELCNERDYIRREVTVAGESRKLIIPYRIENALPKKGLRVRLSDLHWISAFQQSQEEAIKEVVTIFTNHG